MNKRLTTIVLVLMVVWAGVLSLKTYQLKQELLTTQKALVAVTIMTGIYTPADMKASLRDQIRESHPIQGTVRQIPFSMGTSSGNS